MLRFDAVDDSSAKDLSQCRCDSIGRSANNLCWCAGTVLTERQADTIHKKYVTNKYLVLPPSSSSTRKVAQVHGGERLSERSHVHVLQTRKKGISSAKPRSLHWAPTVLGALFAKSHHVLKTMDV